MPPFPGTSLLPSRGYLFFFYEAEESTWGLDPEDAGSWRVVYLEEVGDATPRAAPPGLPRESAFREKHVGFSIVGSYPESTDDRVLALGLSDDGAGMMWGDTGTLYFWIRRDDLRKRDFRSVWVVLQCY